METNTLHSHRCCQSGQLGRTHLRIIHAEQRPLLEQILHDVGSSRLARVARVLLEGEPKDRDLLA